MANIYCTKKLEKVVGKDNISAIQLDSLFGDWNANVFYVNRKKFLFLINDQTCYSVIIPNFVKKDLASFKEKFYQRFIEQMEYDGIKISEKIKSQLDQHSVNFMKTNNNRKIIGTMTKFIQNLEYFLYDYPDNKNLCELNHTMTNNYVSVFSTKKYDMKQPIALMKEKVLGFD